MDNIGYSNDINNEISQEEALFLNYQKTKDVVYRNEIVAKYIGLAEFLSRKFINKGVEYEDIFQVACIALIKAADRFEIQKGVKFVSFATPTILGEIKRFFRDKSSTIKIPRRLYEIRQTLNLARENLLQQLNRAPKINELAEYMGISEETVLEVIESGSSNLVRSLDQNISQDNESDLQDLLGFEEKNYEMIENRDFIFKTLELFNEAEKDFVKMRYIQNFTQKQIAEKFGVSQMYVSRLEKKILDKFRSNIV